jgi:hypothetical protein
VWPRWQRRAEGPDLGGLPWDGLEGIGYLADLEEIGVVLGMIALVIVVGTVLVFALLPLLAFLTELVALPFLALVFRGARVVEARNEATGQVLRFPVHGRKEARERERALTLALGSAASTVEALDQLAATS